MSHSELVIRLSIILLLGICIKIRSNLCSLNRKTYAIVA
jgi:hypothetical protein